MKRIKNVRTQEVANEIQATDSKKVPSYKKPPETIGKGFIEIETMVDLIKAWQQRKILAEDIDFFEKQGGTDC